MQPPLPNQPISRIGLGAASITAPSTPFSPPEADFGGGGEEGSVSLASRRTPQSSSSFPTGTLNHMHGSSQVWGTRDSHWGWMSSAGEHLEKLDMGFWQSADCWPTLHSPSFKLDPLDPLAASAEANNQLFASFSPPNFTGAFSSSPSDFTGAPPLWSGAGSDNQFVVSFSPTVSWRSPAQSALELVQVLSRAPEAASPTGPVALFFQLASAGEPAVMILTSPCTGKWWSWGLIPDAKNCVSYHTWVSWQETQLLGSNPIVSLNECMPHASDTQIPLALTQDKNTFEHKQNYFSSPTIFRCTCWSLL